MYLSKQGSTQAGWIEEQKGMKSQAVPQANQDKEALKWANANPNDPRAMQILKLQGAR